jgi:cytochrome P450
VLYFHLVGLAVVVSLVQDLGFRGIKAGMQFLTLMGDPLGGVETASNYREFSKRLRISPVVRSKTGVLLSANFQICSEVLKSPQWLTAPESPNFMSSVLFGSPPNSDAIDPFFDSLMAKDGEQHARLRKLIQPAFTHRVMQTWKELAEKVADELIADLRKTDGPIELVSQFANPLPIAMICEILGVPKADRQKFTEWGNILGQFGLDGVRSSSELKLLEDASAQVTGYIANLLEKRRAEPGDDLLSVLALAEFEGSTLSNREIVGTGAFLLVAGFETTVNLLGAGTANLVADQEQLNKVARDRALVANLVEESLRFSSPVQMTFRVAQCDLELSDGTRVRAGQSIILMLVGANHDPEIFVNPESFDVERENARRNLAFGFGAHHCIGAALARLEAEVAWNKLLDAFPNVTNWRMIEPPTPRDGKTIFGYKTLKVSLA